VESAEWSKWARECHRTKGSFANDPTMSATEAAKVQRFIYRTTGVCPQEIHFQLQENRLKNVRFIGGGCPGNAQLVSRLLEDQLLDTVVEKLDGIACRNDTSCPDQLAAALLAVRSGELAPMESFRLHRIEEPLHRIGVVADPAGQPGLWERLLAELGRRRPDAAICMGNITGDAAENEDWIRDLGKTDVILLQGERDWRYALREEPAGLPPLSNRRRDWLLRLPQALRFRLGERIGVAFTGDFLQHLQGFSDFDPFALEMNMVFSMTCCMQDTSVFPALEAMTPQFEAGIVVFAQGGGWGHWQVGGVDFVRVGPLAGPRKPGWGMLEEHAGQLRLERIPLSRD
jgi:uncharacterized protein (TIGR03905 family)